MKLQVSRTVEYKLLALDLDGTLIGESPEISARSAQAVQEAARLGVKVTLATGRMYRATRPYAEQLGIVAPLICYQGAQIREPVSGEIISETGVDREIALEVLRYARENGYHVNVFAGDELYMAELTPEGRFYIDRAKVEPNIVGDLAEWLDRDVLKLVLITDEPTTLKIIDELSERFGERLYVTRSFPNYAETISPDASKGKALTYLARRLDIPLENVMAIGDDLNDIDMVAAAGLGVAMRNSAPDVISNAQFVTGTVDEDGVATAIERFIVGKGV